VRRATSVFRFTAKLGLGLAAASASFAQVATADETAETHPRDIPPALYREPMTQADVSLEWYTYMGLLMFVHAEDRKPGLGVDLAAQEYDLGIGEATALVQAVRDVTENTERSRPPISICRAGISSGQAYVDWWASYEKEVRSYRQETVAALIEAVGKPIWEASLERKYLVWLSGGGLGDRINFRKQIEVAPYTIWMRGWCGG